MIRGRTEEDQELSIKDITEIVVEEFHKVGLSPTYPNNKQIVSPDGQIPRTDYHNAMQRISDRCLVATPKKIIFKTKRDIIFYINKEIEQDIDCIRQVEAEYGLNPWPINPAEGLEYLSVRETTPRR